MPRVKHLAAPLAGKAKLKQFSGKPGSINAEARRTRRFAERNYPGHFTSFVAADVRRRTGGWLAKVRLLTLIVDRGAGLTTLRFSAFSASLRSVARPATA